MAAKLQLFFENSNDLICFLTNCHKKEVKSGFGYDY